MSARDPSDDYQPAFWMGGHPVRTSGVIVIFYVATMIATTLALAFGFADWLAPLVFSRDAALHHGAVWQFVTYVMVNPPGDLSRNLWFVVDMFMLWWFGGELEKFFGRRVFLKFYLAIILLAPLIYTILGFFWGVPSLFGAAGSFPVFIAFATLYPNVPVF